MSSDVPVPVRWSVRVLILAVSAVLLPVLGFAQMSPQAESPWSSRTRLQLSGTSASSDPEGYEVYSGIPIRTECPPRSWRAVLAGAVGRP